MSRRTVLTVAGWEVRRAVSGVDRRTLLVAVVALGLVGLVAPLAAGGGAAPDQGIYRVAVDGDSPYAAPVADATSLRRVDPETTVGSGADLAITRGVVTAAATRKGVAARAALRRAVAAYNDRLMDREPDEAAAFPVRVRLRYASQGGRLGPSPNPDPADRTDGADGGGATATTAPGTRAPGTSAPTTTGDGGGGTGPGAGDGLGEAVGGARDALLGGGQTGTPGGLTAPFPVRSLLLAFLFVLPLNVVVQAFGSSVMAERLNRRGEALLVAPASRYTVVAGKTLPYLLAALATTAAIAVAVGAGPVSVLAVAPLAALFLAATFLAAMFARSYKELTFLTVSISVGLTAFAFVPAVFTEVTPVAAISPLSVVVYDLTGGPTGPATVAFATLPVTLVAAVLFALGVGVFREEDMFTQRGVPAKALDALAAQLPTTRRVALWSGLLVPFAFVAELFGVAVLFAVRAPVTVPLLLLVVALVEEATKSVHVLAGFRRGRLPDSDRGAVLAGLASGVGFAVAEKLVLTAQVVGLGRYQLARAAFAPVGLSDPLVVAGLLVAPFALHTVTATVTALGARRSTRTYLGAYLVAVVGHLAYNLGVVGLVA